MSWAFPHYHCCETSTGGDATLSKQNEILQALVALQTTADATEVCVDEIKASTDTSLTSLTSLTRPSVC